MSFSNLKKSTLSDRPRLVTVDQFIDDAVAYANGSGTPQASNQQLLKVVSQTSATATAKMRRATFTLNESTIDSLTELAERTGISRSRIIRILVQHQLRKPNDRVLLDSTLK